MFGLNRALVQGRSSPELRHERTHGEGMPAFMLAGNPNVGKSTVFNALTGMNQHTGNWPGKTVTHARGVCAAGRHRFELIDLPGTYSLMAQSAEEEVTRSGVCFSQPDGVIVVCDATCLERNMNLVLQTIEVTPHVIVCVNLMDEANRKGIRLDLPLLSQRLGVPVIGVTARSRRGLSRLTDAMDLLADQNPPAASHQTVYPSAIEDALAVLVPAVENRFHGRLNSRWLSLRMLTREPKLLREITAYLAEDPLEDPALLPSICHAVAILEQGGLHTGEEAADAVVTALVRQAQLLCQDVVLCAGSAYGGLDRRLDRLLTNRFLAYPFMLGLLGLVFWITLVGANRLSDSLGTWLFGFQQVLTALFQRLSAPQWLHDVLVLGIYRVLAWVVSVMLPPMAIFFPLFTLLEDSGYLPRVAYNLDRPFQRCSACGKQALCMCMGFGCNAAGVVGCRIIDSPRERMLAILTNNFVPCNGRFPALIAVLTMFFAAEKGSSAWSALLLTGIVLLGIFITFGVTGVLSKTVLRGSPSSFTLELPPYRCPQMARVLVRSVLDRTLSILGRAVAVAAPAGLVIWLMANLSVGGVSLLSRCASALDPFARLMGLDGVILMGFVLGFPANEIVLPLIVMGYLAQGSLLELGELAQVKALLLRNGWTWVTALNTMLFSLNHWPCSTTLLTIRKETGSWKWTALAALIPTVVGIVLCVSVNLIAGLFS